MKGLFKLTMAAAALVGLASCSTDDLQMESKKAPAAGNGILVEVEDLIDANSALTRSAFAPDGKTGTLKWNTGDPIKVTDGTLVKYDIYTFDGSAFAFDKASTGRDAAWITEPEYACYDPTNPDPTMEWDNAAKQAIGYYFISPTPFWDEDAENEGAFKSEIPLWGTAEADATYGVKVNMKYLTGVLKINMENVPGNADEIRITGWKNLAGTDPAPMTGNFKAILANDDEIEENAVLVTDGTGQGNTITIDCSGATKGSSVFFVPLIAQKYGLLEIGYVDKTSTYNKIKTVEGLNVERKKYYNLTKSDFDFAGDYPSDITALLAEKKGESEISLKMANATQVISGDQTITIPETSADITLNFNTIAKVSEGILKFEAAGDYAGTLTIKAQNAGSSITNMYFNLPNAKIVIDEGNFSSVDLGADATTTPATYNEPSTLVAKALSIGAKGKVHNIYANAELGYGNDGVDFVMVKGSEVNAFELEKNYKADQIEIAGQLGAGAADIDMTAWQDKDDKNITISTVKIGDGANINDLTTYSDVEVSGGQVAKIISDGNVTIGGVDNTTTPAKENGQVGTIERITNITAANKAVTKNVIVKEEGTLGTLTPYGYNRYNLTVNGKAGVTATATALTLTIDGTTAYVNNATIDGAVTITDTEEADAVQGTLTVNAGQTLTLNGGYINTISVNPVTISGKAQWLTIKHGATAAFTAINSITGTGKWKVDTTTKSIWNGKKIGYNANGTTNALNTKYGNPTVIYTACQLATSNAAAELYSNIDLNNQAWTLPSLAGDFAGKDMDGSVDKDQLPTIENLKLVAAANKTDISGVALFGTASAAATISNITVKNVTSEITEANGKNVTSVATLVGNAGAHAIIFENVKVNTANIGATVADNIGGLVGETTGAITLNNVSITGLTLNGQYRIGGVVGKTTAAISTATKASTITVTAINVPASFNAEPDIKVVAEDTKDYGTVGMIAGEASAAVTDAVKLTVNNLIKGNRQKYGYKMRWFNAGPNVRYYFGERGDDHTNKNVWIGRLTTDDAALTAGTYIVTNATQKTAFEEDWNNPTHCYSVKHDMYDALDSEY